MPLATTLWMRNITASCTSRFADHLSKQTCASVLNVVVVLLKKHSGLSRKTLISGLWRHDFTSDGQFPATHVEVDL